MSSSVSGIHGHVLEVTVVGCNKLKDTEWISRQDPYVCLEYASTKHRTRTCTDGGRNPSFQDKFVFSLIEGLRELNVTVWNSNTVTYDDFIGSGKIQLHKVLSQGYDDTTWPLQTKSGRAAGQVRLIMHFENNKKPEKLSAPYAPPYQAPPYSAPPYQAPSYSAPPYQAPSYSAPPYQAPADSAPAPTSYPPAYSSYPPTSAYSPYPYAPPSHQPGAYLPPPSAYPPPCSVYPPPPRSVSPPLPRLVYPPPPRSVSPPLPRSLYPPPPSQASSHHHQPPQASPYYPSAPYQQYPPPPPRY